jgi:tripartite-type tricarboxylate transporter receptor subunit TctC
MMSTMNALQRLFVATLLFTATVAASAQEGYPNRTIRIIVPAAAGANALDVIARIIAEKLSATWSRPVIVENRSGASTNIGAEAAAKSEPDGYTLLATPPATLVINQSFYPKLGYDPRAFVPITVIASYSNVLVVGPRAPFSTFSGLLAFAKENPDKLSYASPGIGTSPHVAMEWLKKLAGIRLTHIAYKGLTPAMSDVVAGHVDLMFGNAFTVLPLVRSGQFRALGVDSAKRIVELPEVPSIAETFPGYVLTSWIALVAPPGTPPEIAAKLSAAVAAALREPDVAKKLRDLSAVAVGTSPAETAAFIRRESDRWHEIIALAGIRPE